MNKIPNTKNKNQKGITLIALIITIIILLILAVVAISAVTGDGILRHATNARDEYGRAQENEASTLDEYLSKIEENLPGGNSGEGEEENPGEEDPNAPVPYIVDEDGNDAQDKVLSTTSNTNVYDRYGNKVVVPAGFKVTTDGNYVTDGIVIEDCTNSATAGSQFVWIPVGEVKYEEDGESKSTTIELKRYVFASDGSIDETLTKTEPGDQLKTSSSSSSYFTEGLANSTTSNAHALDIEAFRTSAETKGGYYLGRYEARTATARTSRDNALTQITCKSSEYIYNYVTQAQASSQARGMYTSSNFTSDLINSYAWDTAIVFIQTFEDADYSRQITPNTSFVTAGQTSLDKVCNIYDMAGNCHEWSTETSSRAGNPCICRGGYFIDNYSSSYNYPSFRYDYGTSVSHDVYSYSFRPLLYVAL